MKTISHTLNYTMVDYIVRITMPNKFFSINFTLIQFHLGIAQGSLPNENATSSAPIHSLVILRGFDRGIFDGRDFVLDH